MHDSDCYRNPNASQQRDSGPIPIHEINNGRRVNAGRVEGGVFIKQVFRSRHFYRKYQGWAASVASVRDAMDNGAEWIQINEMESGESFKVSIAGFLRHGIEEDKGYGKQIVLPEASWKRSDENRKRWERQSRRKPQAKTQRPSMVQSGLWEATR